MRDEERSAELATLETSDVVGREACCFGELDLGPCTTLSCGANPLTEPRGELFRCHVVFRKHTGAATAFLVDHTWQDSIFGLARDKPPGHRTAR